MVFESIHADDFTAPVMAHRFHKLLVPIRGAGWVDIARRRRSLRPGVLVVVPSDTTHTLGDEPGQPLTLLAVCFAAGVVVATRLPMDRPLWGADEPAGPTAVRTLLRRMLHEQARRQPGWELMLRGLLAQALATLVRRQQSVAASGRRTATEAVREVVDWVERDPVHAGNLETVARQFGVSRRRLTELYRRATGETYRRHVERLRIEHAHRLLLDSRRTVAAIAFECGFDDLSSFYRAFKRVEGRPPLTVRGR